MKAFYLESFGRRRKRNGIYIKEDYIGLGKVKASQSKTVPSETCVHEFIGEELI